MTNSDNIKTAIDMSKTYLGIELGSTRIKAVLIDEKYMPIASGDYLWANNQKDGFWTYDINEVWHGIQSAFLSLKDDVQKIYNIGLTSVGAIGVSGMMHGYLPFDTHDELLVPFRTWRNNLQSQSSEFLTELLNYPIPQRWSIAHLYQAVLNKEAHIDEITFQTTLAGYVHWQLTGEKVIGVGEASGMFPIDLNTKDYNADMVHHFNELMKDHGHFMKIENVMPKVLQAGELAGRLTEKGSKLLDPTGSLQMGIAFCPPEGDAGTGMVATNCTRKKKSVVSAGTSIFGMVVLEDDLRTVHKEVDQVMTPSGELVAMVHVNNCTSDLNDWVNMFDDTIQLFGLKISESTLYETLYKTSLEGANDCGGLLSYGYHSGEHITHFEEGRPLFVRHPNSVLSISNFMRTHLYSALAVLKLGFDILFEEEHIEIASILGHGGLFKTEGVGQRFLAAAMNTSVSVMETAGEGGPYGMALLAAYLKCKNNHESLDDFLSNEVFSDQKVVTIIPNKEEVIGFNQYIKRYKDGLHIEGSAVKHFA